MCKCTNDKLYEITTQPQFAEAVQASVLEYRFLIGKNYNNYNLRDVFKAHRVAIYDGRKQQSSEATSDQSVSFVLDIRHDFVYGVYRRSLL